MSSKGGEVMLYTMKLAEKDRPDPTKYDPTIRFDLLAKVQEVELASGRNIFQFGAAPPPPKTPEQLALAKIPIGPRPVEPVKTDVQAPSASPSANHAEVLRLLHT
jgi:hypothetical protein